MSYIDLTHNLRNTIPVFPGDPEFNLKNIIPNNKDTPNNEDTFNNEDYTLYEIKAGLHSGTHIDAPFHYYHSGKLVSELKLDKLILAVQ
ncbi:cyclase family protein [Methanobrevibacter filiformis]|uniref:Kynurenine formamidase n=1 Tax=Methanobrevibacter filiformis TaxID=55758 RepID=A0A166CHT2_9EURY|nr:cyclase family protein [Methanobrevibacter filiformis]KZX14477.1 kynurenine formamidase [Methanobrevibacter filiformis]